MQGTGKVPLIIHIIRNDVPLGMNDACRPLGKAGPKTLHATTTREASLHRLH